MFAIHAEFDQYLNEPVTVSSVALLQDWIIANHQHQLQETWHISLPFATTGPGTESAGPSHTKLLNRSGPVFVDHSNSILDQKNPVPTIM